jgi:endothelin-converting enzyme/putative endopeptidase
MNKKVIGRLALGAAALAIAIPAVAKIAATAPRYGAFGIDLTTQDKAVKPGDDFWTYANGAWAKRTEIPADKGSVGYGNILSDEAEVNVRKILDDMAANPARPASRSAISTQAGWTKRGSRPKALRRSSPIWRRSRRSTT